MDTNKKLAIPFATWNFKPLFDGDDDPKILEEQKIVEAANKAFIVKWKERSDYLENPAVLREALDEYEVLERNVGQGGQASYYLNLRTTQNAEDPVLKGKAKSLEDFSAKLSNEMLFFPLRLGKVPPEKQEEFLTHQDLAPYRHFLERLFQESKHMLTEEVEKVLTLKSPQARDNWEQMIEQFVSEEKHEVLCDDGSRQVKSFSDILSMVDSTQKAVRDGAATVIHEILARIGKVAEHEINSLLQDKKTNDELRAYSRPDSSRHLADDIDTEVVDTLVESVARRFDIAQRFYQLKARLMGVTRLAYHERNVPYGAVETEYSFEDAAQLVYRTFQELNMEFANIFERFLKNGQMDLYPHAGKRGGAFCASGYLSSPTFILLNFTRKLNDVLTLAHETGHGINNELMRTTTNALSFGSPLSTAEVASTFMEDFVLKELLKQANEEERLAIYVKRLGDDVSTIFRQIACYRFEQELHKTFREKMYLSQKEIGEIFLKHMASYMGPAVEQSKGSENWWVYWGHIRTYFYVYSYASGLLISKSMQNAVRQNSSFITNVKEFLASGMSDSPKNIFARMDIDIADKEFWNRGLDEVDRMLDETEALAQKLGKI